MFNSSIFGTFDTIEDATFGIEEFCSTESAAKAYDSAYDAYVADEACSGTYWDSALTADDF